MTSSIRCGKEAAWLTQGSVCSIPPLKMCIAVWKCLCFYGEMFSHLRIRWQNPSGCLQPKHFTLTSKGVQMARLLPVSSFSKQTILKIASCLLFISVVNSKVIGTALRHLSFKQLLLFLSTKHFRNRLYAATPEWVTLCRRCVMLWH